MGLFKKTAQQKALNEKKKEARKDARADRKDARQDARADKKDARQEARDEKKDARVEKRDAMKDIRQSDLKGENKRDAKKAVRDEKKTEVRDARHDKRDEIAEVKDTKKTAIKDARETKRAALAALRVPKALDRKWASYLRFQTVDALEIYQPKTLGHLKSIMQVADETRCKVRAIGSGHSFSEIGVTDDIFVQTHKYSALLPLTPAVRRRRFKEAHQDARTSKLVEFEVGITIIELSKALEKDGLALANQGTYDGQTFWGAVSTSTHGSGVTRQPFPDMVLSVVLVTEGGRAVRIEPADGVTQPRGWSEPGIDELIQNDDLFYAVICSMGCMGIVYSAIIKARPMYWLNEWTFIATWSDVKAELSQPGRLRATLDEWEIFTMMVSPHKARKGKKDGVEFAGEFPCCLTYLRETDDRRTIGGNFFDSLAKFLEKIEIIHGKTPYESPFGVIPRVWKRGSGKIPVRMGGKHAWQSMWPDPEEQAPDRRNKCFKIFPKGGKIPGGYGIEVAFPIDDTFTVMDRIIRVAANAERAGRFHSAPVAIRYVAPSRAWASPQYGRETVMLEVLMAKGTEDGRETLENMERELLKLPNVRIHWGLEMDVMSGTMLPQMYPEWERWMRAYRRFNARGTFNNTFTDRLGISR
jgi:hypothetical protein